MQCPLLLLLLLRHRCGGSGGTHPEIFATRRGRWSSWYVVLLLLPPPIGHKSRRKRIGRKKLLFFFSTVFFSPFLFWVYSNNSRIQTTIGAIGGGPQSLKKGEKKKKKKKKMKKKDVCAIVGDGRKGIEEGCQRETTNIRKGTVHQRIRRTIPFSCRCWWWCTECIVDCNREEQAANARSYTSSAHPAQCSVLRAQSSERERERLLRVEKQHIIDHRTPYPWSGRQRLRKHLKGERRYRTEKKKHLLLLLLSAGHLCTDRRGYLFLSLCVLCMYSIYV